MRLHSSLEFALASLILVFSGAAQAGALGDMAEEYQRVLATGTGSHQINIDNDSLLLRRDDRLYTSGIGYVYRSIAREQGGTVAWSWSLNQELYTSLDTSLTPPNLGPPDHPYAAWLHAGLTRQVQHADGSGNSIGVDIGCLGPCAGGERSQDVLHRIISQKLPQGWGAQLKNEVGIVLQADLSPVRWAPMRNVDITPNLHGRFGNIFTDAGVGVTLRAGRLNQLPDEPTLHAYLRLDGRAVAYNATLQGGYFSQTDPHAVAPKRAVGEYEAGVTWAERHLAATVAFVRRGNEIRDLSNAVGAQNFLRLQFTYTP
ncbi:MAG: lipid deacylase LpxR family protein [Herminiimonas sp.]|nr:lipid deacylase LpxR family protein [Herminiimonas sp.]